MRAQQIRLDLEGFVERLRGRELVDAGEERLGILVERLVDVAADLGAFADRTRHSGLDNFGGLLRTRVELGSTSLGSFSLLLDEIAGSLGDFQVLEVLEGFSYGREGVFEAVQHRIGLG